MIIRQDHLDRLIAMNKLVEAYTCSVHEATNQQQQTTSHKHINPTNLRNIPMLYAVAMRNKARSRERSGLLSSNINLVPPPSRGVATTLSGSSLETLVCRQAGSGTARRHQAIYVCEISVRSIRSAHELGSWERTTRPLGVETNSGRLHTLSCLLGKSQRADHFSQGFPHKLASSACSTGRLLE